MKCIWRILLGVLTAGLSEVFRHKSHDKTLPCPDPVTFYVDLGTLAVGDVFIHEGLTYQVLVHGASVSVKHLTSGNNYEFAPNLKVLKLY